MPDTGIGIAEGFLESIADMFKQVSRQHNEERACTGLGFGLAVGFTDQLCKPVRMDELTSKLGAIHKRRS